MRRRMILVGLLSLVPLAACAAPPSEGGGESGGASGEVAASPASGGEDSPRGDDAPPGAQGSPPADGPESAGAEEVSGIPTGAESVEPAPSELAEAFREEMSRLAEAAAAAGEEVVEGRQGWLFFAPELRHVGVGRFWGERAAEVSRAARPEDADPLPAILDFHRQLEAAGVELLFVPAPAKALVYPEEVSEVVRERVAAGEVPPRLDLAHRTFLDRLAAEGVAVLDLVPRFLAHRAEHPEPGARLHCRQDTHWSPRACSLVAGEIAAWVRARPELAAAIRAGAEAVKPARREGRIEIEGDLWRLLPEPRPPREELPITWVGRAGSGGSGGAGLEPLSTPRESPVLVLGDSHALVFHAGEELHARGAGLVDHLAAELGVPVDLIGVRGSGATPARVNLLRRGDGLAGKKLVVWVLSMREYTEGQGWKKVPVSR